MQRLKGTENNSKNTMYELHGKSAAVPVNSIIYFEYEAIYGNYFISSKNIWSKFIWSKINWILHFIQTYIQLSIIADEPT